MPIVQCAEGGDEAYAPVLDKGLSAPVAQWGDLAEDVEWRLGHGGGGRGDVSAKRSVVWGACAVMFEGAGEVWDAESGEC